MWRLLPVILLVGCAGYLQKSQDADPEARFRVIRAQEVPLGLAVTLDAKQPRDKAFRQGDMRGQIDRHGVWDISASVVHSRIRCATYQVGIQVGTGNPGCSFVQWTTDVQYGTRRTHCNSAELIHRGGGALLIDPRDFEAATCARVVTRCAGGC